MVPCPRTGDEQQAPFALQVLSMSNRVFGHVGECARRRHRPVCVPTEGRIPTLSPMACCLGPISTRCWTTTSWRPNLRHEPLSSLSVSPAPSTTSSPAGESPSLPSSHSGQQTQCLRESGRSFARPRRRGDSSLLELDAYLPMLQERAGSTAIRHVKVVAGPRTGNE